MNYPKSQKDFVRFDMTKKPFRQQWYLRPLTWILSFPDVLKHKAKVTKIDMEGVKPPYLLLGNHNAFLDFKVCTWAIFPHRANYIVAIDGFIKRELLMRLAGCICKRKFTNDILMVRHLKRVIENGDVLVVYPEARYSLCGTNAIIPDSVGKLVKLLNVPVVTLITYGHHVNSPFWNLQERGNHTEATLKQLMSKQQVKDLTIEQINALIDQDFQYDDFAWQRDNKVAIAFENRAKGLHKVLYQCPNCLTEYKMDSDKDQIWCNHCKKHWQMNEYGQLQALEGETKFSHIPDWYEWERANVRAEVENKTYFFQSPVHVDSLPNAKGYIPLGKGVLTHDHHGFKLVGKYHDEPYEMIKPVDSQYACHIEYDYLGKYGDCVDLNTLDDTYYIYPEATYFSVTKISLATEELYKHYIKKN